MSDERLKKSAGETRKTRKAADRAVTQNRELSEDERVDAFRQQFHQSALPDLPELPGYHTCWLTTTNPRDSIQARVRLGYEPIKPEDVPGWEYATVKTGDHLGCIGVNEMLAFKLPLSLYHKYMHENHRRRPDEEQELLVQRTDQMKQQAQQHGARLIEGDGMESLREAVGHAEFE